VSTDFFQNFIFTSHLGRPCACAGIGAGLQTLVPAPQVSVVIPVFNAAGSLRVSIQSIVAQSFSAWEIIAVNDGSTDHTGTLLNSLAKTEPRIRVFHEPHRGIVSALNFGLDRARGELIARMDADDWAFPNRLEQQIKLLRRESNVGLVGSLVEFGGSRNDQTGYALHVDWLNSVGSAEQVGLNRFIECPFAHPSIMFRRDLILRHGGYREGDFPEDYELILRWLEAGVLMAKVPRVLLRWNDSPDRLSRCDRRYHAAAFYRTKAVYLARWLRDHVAPERSILVWGAGRLTRRRAELLETEGVRVCGFVDTDPRKLGRQRDGREVIPPERIPTHRACFVLGYVAKRGARELIRESLSQRGFAEGQDFLIVA
jgi:glycosyltransferase involved in cell wall biosynthesis